MKLILSVLWNCEWRCTYSVHGIGHRVHKNIGYILKHVMARMLGTEVENCSEVDRTYGNCCRSRDARCTRIFLHHPPIPQVSYYFTIITTLMAVLTYCCSFLFYSWFHILIVPLISVLISYLILMYCTVDVDFFCVCFCLSCIATNVTGLALA